MNANELADAMDTHGFRYHHVKKAVAMLRKQQAEIEEWKRKYKDMHNLATQAMSKVHEIEKAQEK